EHDRHLRAAHGDRLIEPEVRDGGIVGVTTVDVVHEDGLRPGDRQPDTCDRRVRVAALDADVARDADPADDGADRARDLRYFVTAKYPRLPVRVLLAAGDIRAVRQRIDAAE